MESARYNQIPHIDDQPAPSISQLLGLGEIIVRHNLEARFGLHLLHRHFEIKENTVMFNYVDEEKEISSMTSLSDIDEGKIRPQCFLFDRDAGFISYEYGYDEDRDATIPEPLATDLAGHFAENNIGHLLAIERIDGNTKGLCAEFPYGEFATFRTPVNSHDRTPDVATDTAWIFRKAADGSIALETTCYWRAGC